MVGILSKIIQVSVYATGAVYAAACIIRLIMDWGMMW